MSLQKCWSARLTNEFWRGYTSHLVLGCISRAYRRLEISSPGRCSLKPRPLVVHPIRLPQLSHSLGSQKDAKCERFIPARELRRVSLSPPFSPSSFSREHELPDLKLCSRDSDYVLEFRSITFEDAWRESSVRDHSNTWIHGIHEWKMQKEKKRGFVQCAGYYSSFFLRDTPTCKYLKYICMLSVSLYIRYIE